MKRKPKIKSETLPCGCIIIKNISETATARVFVNCKEGHQNP